MATRRHDIDALRVLAFALLIAYHLGMVYVADWQFHIKSSYQAEWLQWPMIAINRWRMPLLFSISGIAIGLARPERGLWRFAGMRTWRLLLPLVFGMLVIVPVQAYCEAVAGGHVAPGFGGFLLRYWHLGPWPRGSFAGSDFGITWNHLWYLAYLWPYTMLLLAFIPLTRTRIACAIAAAARRQHWLIYLPIVWLAACNVWLDPRFPPTHALAGDWTVHAESLPLVLFGYWIALDTALWQHLQRRRWTTLPIALLAITVELSLRAAGRYLPPGHIPPALQHMPWGAIDGTARATYTWMALLAIFGWGRVLLDRPFRWLPYCTEAVFPWYILHQSLIVPLAFWLIPLRLGPVLEPVLVLSGTVAGCLLLHELVIRRSTVLRPLFGCRLVPRRVPIDATAAPSTAVPAHGDR